MDKDQFTLSEQMLAVGHGHKLYVQDWGNKSAKVPIIFLHGGPGSGVSDKHRQMFDPKLQRVILFDQRGSGKSQPTGSLEHNTTADSVEDIEKIAQEYKLDKFVVVGGSWGACLGLAFALKYPKRVEALVLRGIFTGSQSEIDFIDKGHFRAFFPDVWDAYLARTPKRWHQNPGEYHAPRVLAGSKKAKLESTYAYSELEGSLIGLDDRHSPEPIKDFDLNSTRVEVHYLVNQCFMSDRYILDNAHKLKMPVHLIQGRYDMVCPPVTAYELHKQLPNSRLIWTTAGHSGNDRANYDLVRSICMQITP